MIRRLALKQKKYSPINNLSIPVIFYPLFECTGSESPEALKLKDFLIKSSPNFEKIPNEWLYLKKVINSKRI